MLTGMPDQDPTRTIRTIQVDESADGYFTVRIGDLYADKMDSGECLWMIANLLIHPNWRLPVGGLKTKEEHEARNRPVYGYEGDRTLELHQRLLPPSPEEFCSI